LAFIAKAVWGRVRVAFNSGAGDTGTPIEDANLDANLLKNQCKQRGAVFLGNKPNPATVYCVWKS